MVGCLIVGWAYNGDTSATVNVGEFCKRTQIRISLAHNANDDLCRAWLTEDYHFDLTPIKTLYQESYQQEAGTIILSLKDTPNQELVYEFTM